MGDLIKLPNAISRAPLTGNELQDWLTATLERTIKNATCAVGDRDDEATAKSFARELQWCVRQLSEEHRLATRDRSK